jgi:hypothetical protein
VVNNAGYAQPGAIEDVDDEEVRRRLETDLVAPARIARLVLPAMRERRAGGGHPRTEFGGDSPSSLAGRVSLPVLGWYCAGKRGLEAVTDAPISAYRDQYEAAGDLARRDLPGPRPVARTVLKALSARRPPPRYLVGGGARPTAVLDAALPTPATDWAKQLATSLRTAPPRVARTLDRVRGR